MKKILIVLLAVTAFLFAAAAAESISSLPGAGMPETPDSTPLYYHPGGGQYYHADPNCIRVHEKYLPLSGVLSYGDLEKEEFRDLQPCEVCGAPARREAEPPSVSFRGAVDAGGEGVSVGGDVDYLAAVLEKDGKVLRLVTLLDDRAKELYMAGLAADDSGETFEAFTAYAWSLPVTYSEELTAKPKQQAELDAQAGKTVGELLDQGYSLYGSGGGVDLPTVVDLSCGLFNYAFEADASFEEYQEYRDRDDLASLRVKSGKLSGFSSLATNPDYLADGTYAPRVVPHITAEDAAAAADVPPPEEYAAEAQPLTAEAYAALVKDVDAGYGRVYRVEGTVRQVLSRNPLTLVVNTGTDGDPRPVVIECAGGLSLSPEAGSPCRVFADVSSACYLLPVLTARYVLTP